MSRATSDAQGRLDHGPPIAVVDIGSNSVRLVVYEGLTRSPTEIFNEKALCGLGREVQSTRLLAADAVQHALSTLKRFRALCQTMGVKKTLAIATAACRDAKNGPAFIKLAERTIARRYRRAIGRRARPNSPRSASFPACTGPTASSAISAAARSNSSMCAARARAMA